MTSESVILIFRHVSQPATTVTARDGLLQGGYYCADTIKSLHRKTTYPFPNSESRHQSVSTIHSSRAVHFPTTHTITNGAKINPRSTIQCPHDSITRRKSHSHTDKKRFRR